MTAISILAAAGAALGAGPVVQTTGAISVTAAFTGAVGTTAKGDTTVGSTAGIGLSLALAVVNHTVDAHTDRSLSAGGALSFSATGSSQAASSDTIVSTAAIEELKQAA